MDAAVKLVDVLELVGFVVRLDEVLQTGAQRRQRGRQAFNERLPQFGQKFCVPLGIGEIRPGGRGRRGPRGGATRDGAAVADGLADDVQNVLGRAIGLGQAFVGAGLPGFLNQVGQVGVGKNDDGHLGKIRLAADSV